MRCFPERQAGFTLIEVMTAGVILSALVVGLTQLWAAVGERSVEDTVHQKAVFVLDGEMSRLSALYNLTGFGGSVTANTTSYGSPEGYPDTRAIYRLGSNVFMASGGDAFVTDQVETFETGPNALVLLLDKAGESADRNFVWIDRSRGLLGRLSWFEAEIPPVDCALSDTDAKDDATSGGLSCLCFDWSGGPGGAQCREITLVLEHPFRLDESGNAITAGKITSIMPLKTIVGRWR